jgi:hypothetical protein
MVRRLWWLMAGAVGAVLALFAAMPDRFRALGVNHLGPWFLDLYAILASNDALARGLDPYAHNPLDVFGRPHVYSHWWLSLGSVGLTRDDILWLGAALGTAFVGAALAWLRPRRLGEVVGALAVLNCFTAALHPYLMFMVASLSAVAAVLSPRRAPNLFVVVAACGTPARAAGTVTAVLPFQDLACAVVSTVYGPLQPSVPPATDLRITGAPPPVPALCTIMSTVPFASTSGAGLEMPPGPPGPSVTGPKATHGPSSACA